MKGMKILTATALSLTISGTLATGVSAASLNCRNDAMAGNNQRVFYGIAGLQDCVKNISNNYPNVIISQGNNWCRDIQFNNGYDQIFCPPARELPEKEIPQTPEPNAPEKEIPEVGDELSYSEQVAVLVNQERAKYGLSAVTVKTDLQAAALIRSNEIQSSFSHTRPDGSSYYTAIQEQNAFYRGSGENIAYGQRSPEAVMSAWMSSAGHRANILNANYTSIGVGHSRNNNGIDYWTQLFGY